MYVATGRGEEVLKGSRERKLLKQVVRGDLEKSKMRSRREAAGRGLERKLRGGRERMLRTRVANENREDIQDLFCLHSGLRLPSVILFHKGVRKTVKGVINIPWRQYVVYSSHPINGQGKPCHGGQLPSKSSPAELPACSILAEPPLSS